MHDTGSLRADLVQAVRYVIAVLTTSTEGSIIPALTADLVRDASLAETFRANQELSLIHISEPTRH